MRKLFSLIAILLSSVAAYCQTNDSEGSVLLNTQPNWERLLKNEAKKPLINGYQFSHNQMPIAASTVTALYSHGTYKGNVYILQQDNMPCLVPDKQTAAVMPTWNIPLTPMPKASGIPNALEQKSPIFETP